MEAVVLPIGSLRDFGDRRSPFMPQKLKNNALLAALAAIGAFGFFLGAGLFRCLRGFLAGFDTLRSGLRFLR